MVRPVASSSTPRTVYWSPARNVTSAGMTKDPLWATAPTVRLVSKMPKWWILNSAALALGKLDHEYVSVEQAPAFATAAVGLAARTTMDDASRAASASETAGMSNRFKSDLHFLSVQM